MEYRVARGTERTEGTMGTGTGTTSTLLSSAELLPFDPSASLAVTVFPLAVTVSSLAVTVSPLAVTVSSLAITVSSFFKSVVVFTISGAICFDKRSLYDDDLEAVTEANPSVKGVLGELLLLRRRPFLEVDAEGKGIEGMIKEECLLLFLLLLAAYLLDEIANLIEDVTCFS
jgi:hypothetical protein